MRSGPKPRPQCLVKHTPSPPDAIIIPPDPPGWCGPDDARLWWVTCQTLVDRQQLTTGDLKAVEGFVLSWSMVDAARTDGRHRDLDKYLLTTSKLSRELGLTPSARETMRAPVPPADESVDSLERFKRGEFDEVPTGRRLADSD